MECIPDEVRKSCKQVIKDIYIAPSLGESITKALAVIGNTPQDTIVFSPLVNWLNVGQ